MKTRETGTCTGKTGYIVDVMFSTPRIFSPPISYLRILSDVADDVRRAAVTALGFVLCNEPARVPKVYTVPYALSCVCGWLGVCVCVCVCVWPDGWTHTISPPSNQ